MIVAYTSIYGRYDQLKQHPAVDWIDRWLCYTDDPNLACPGWEIIVEAQAFEHPRVAAKWRKTHPPEADQSIWIDGSMDIHNAEFFDHIRDGLTRADMVLFSHPERSSLIAEAYVSQQMVKYSGLPVLEQAEHYIEQWGWPDAELWASTTIGRRHTPAVLQMGAAWFAENEHWTYQDQISLPPLLHRYQIPVAALPFSLWRNPWFVLRPHASDQ